LTISLSHARPDPLLGEFASSPEPPQDERDEHRVDALSALGAIDVREPETGGSSAEVLAGLDFAGDSAGAAEPAVQPPPAQPMPAPTPSAAVRDEPDAAEEDEDDDAPAGVSWPVLLLASYASAVTLGLFWVLWTGRRIREDLVEAPTAFDSRPDPGARADRSRRVLPPRPIPAEHMAKVGAMARLGQIEATPVAIIEGPVTLKSQVMEKTTKPGGERALKLRLRLRNVSSDVVLAPFDEAFIRDRVGADPESFIETGDGQSPIAMYPLAVESEWSIPGQVFRELKPGETLETVAVSAPEATSRLTSEMTWRIRLRSDINHTDDLGVRFGLDDVKSDSPTSNPRRRD
jgi:hypothetical protein